MEELDVWLGCEQPTTCPKCGARTDILRDIADEIQHHKCLREECGYEFILEFDDEEF